MWIFRRRYHKHVQQFKCQWGIHASLQNKVIPGHVEQSSISNPEKGRRKPHLFAFPFLLPPLRFPTWTSARDPACDHRRLASSHPHPRLFQRQLGGLQDLWLHSALLEEHVYLCFLTINRARGLVVKEMAMNHQRSWWDRHRRFLFNFHYWCLPYFILCLWSCTGVQYLELAFL